MKSIFIPRLLQFIVASFFLLLSVNTKAQISGNDTVCIGDIFTYTTSLSGTITWSVSPSGPGITASGSTAVITWASAANTYTITANNGTSTETFNVVSFALPNPVISYQTNACSAVPHEPGGGPAGDAKCDTFCIDEIVTYSVIDVPGNTYSWTIFGGTIISGLGTNSVEVEWGTGPNCGYLCLTEYNPAGCNKSQCVFGISAYPSGTINISATPNPVCLGSPVTFSVTATGGPFVSFDWDFGNGNYTTTYGATNVVNAYYVAGTYTVVLTANTDCCTITDTLEIEVESLPGPDIFCITPVCSSEEGVQYCTSATGCSYDWIVSGGFITAGLNTNCITVDWGAGPTGTISLVTTGCSPAVCSDTTTVTVPIMPNGAFNITGQLVVCVNTTGNYAAPYVPGSQYTWTLVPPSGPAVILPYNIPPYQQDILFTTVGNYTLICHMQNDILECYGDDTIQISVLPAFDIQGPTTLCLNDPGNFTSNPLTSCTWTTTAPGNGTQFGNGATFNFNNVGTFTVTAVATNPLAVCQDTVVYTVVVNPLPAVPVIIGPTIACAGGTYVYSVSGYPASTSYQWSFIDNNFNFSFGTSNPFTITTAPTFTSGTLTLVVTDNGCTNQSTITINAPATPAPTFTVNPFVCPDAIDNYTAILSYPGLSDVNWTINPPAAGTVVSGQGTGSVAIEWHSVNPNVAQSVSITITETICLTNVGTYTQNLTIYPLPVITAAGADFCPGGSTLLTATGGTSYQWFDVNSAPVSPTVTLPGSYYVIGTDGNGCTAKAYVTVASLPQPVASISTPDFVLCDTNGVMLNTINLYALDNGYTFSWSPGASTANPLAVSSTGVYSVTVTDANGCTNTDSYIVECVEVDTCPLPLCVCTNGPITISQITPNCNDITFNSNSSCTGTPSWQFGDLTGATGTTVTHTYIDAGYYQVCYSNGDPGCCPPPPACTVVDIPVGANFAVEMLCNTVTVFNNASVLPPYTITGYYWDFGDGFTTTASNPGPHTYSTAGPFTIICTVTASNNCTATFQQIVTPAGPDISATFVTTACNGPVNFAAIINSGNVVDWDWDFGDTYGSNVANPQHIYDIPGTYTVTLTGTSSNGCIDVFTGTITITAPPPPFALIYTTPNCGSVTISTSGTYSTYQWYNNGNIINGATSSTYVATQSGNYTLEVTDANGCMITSNVASVVVNPQPVIFLTVPNLICRADPFSISTNVIGAYNFTWTVDGNPYFSGPTLNIPGFGLAPGPHTVTVIAFDPSTGCADTATTVFNIKPSPNVFISSSDPSGVCSGDSIQLTAITAATGGYLWSTGSVINPIYVTASGNYSVTVTDAAGCTASANINATINPLPDLSMLPIGCDSACINPDPDTIHGPPGMLSYNWLINNVTTSTAQDLILNTTNMPVFGIPYTVTLIATTTFGCVDTASFEYTPIDCDSAACFDLIDSIYCNPDGTFTLNLVITNNNAATSTYLWLHDINAPFTFTPTFVVPLTLTQGQTSAPIPIIVSFPPGPLPTDICFKASLYNTDSCCHDSMLYCIPVPDCSPCGNVSVSADSTDDCCKTIDITNNYASNYFSGVQFVPISTGTSIASAQLGLPYLGSWSGMGNSTQMTFTPNSGFIPTGTTAGLVELCLNLTPAAPSPQIVIVNWFVSTPLGDSIACTDTLLFYCDAPLENPCGDIHGEITCVGDGTYQYDFTFTNNSTHNVTMLVFTNTNPVLNVIPNPIMLGSPVVPGDSITSSVIIDPGMWPPGTDFCFDLTLADATGWCCHEMDSICITLPECDTCECGNWDLFTMGTSDGLEVFVECGINISIVNPGTTVTFLTGGYNCIGDSTCVGEITWTLNGPVTTSGIGLPTFTVTTGGVYTLTIVGSCDGNACDTCVITFTVPEVCDCGGGWQSFGMNVDVPGALDYSILADCGELFTSIPVGTVISAVSGGYLCTGDPAACPALIKWSLTDPLGNSITGVGYPTFTTSLPGTYSLTFSAVCNGEKCGTCSIKFNVEDVALCDCGTWGPITVKKGAKNLKNQLCGTGYNWTTNTPIIITGAYTCAGPADCLTTYTWTATRNGVFYTSGTSMPVNFTPTLNGTYVVTIIPICNGVECPPCEFTFKAKTPIAKEGNVELESLFNMRIAPNPASTNVKVTVEEATDNYGNIQIVNELGVVVLESEIRFEYFNTIELNIEMLPAGCYMVRYIGENESQIQQLVIVK